MKNLFGMEEVLCENNMNPIGNVMRVMLFIAAIIKMYGKCQRSLGQRIVGIETIVHKVINKMWEFILFVIIFLLFGLLCKFSLLTRLQHSSLDDWLGISFCLSIMVMIIILLMGSLYPSVTFSVLVWNVCLVVYLLLGFTQMALLEWLLANKGYKSVVPIAICSIFKAIVIELSLFSRDRNLLQHKYYIIEKNRRYYIHKSHYKDVECSYNRKMDREKGYKIEKLKDIKKQELFYEPSITPYDYLKRLLKENTYEVVQDEILSNCNIEKIREKFCVEIENQQLDIPVQNHTYVIVLKGKKGKLNKKIQNIKRDKNKSCVILDAELKEEKVLVLIMSCKTRLSFKHVCTNKLFEYIEDMATTIEYSFLKKSKIELLG